MASRNKILKQADRLAHRGHHAEAASTLLKLVEENPRDVALLNRAGDLFVRAGLVDDAIQQFETIAAFFKDDGFLLKAIAIYTKISKLDPSRMETYLQLGELYAERGLRMEAKQNLLRAAEGFKDRGNSDAARRTLERLETLEPEDQAVRGKMLDMLEEGGEAEQASVRHLDTARKLIEGGQRDEGLAALEKALGAETSDPVLLSGMADILLQTGDPARAAGLLDRALPGIETPDFEFLLMLGRAKREAGDPDGAKTHLEEALKLDFGNDRCHVEMALSHLAASDTERAFEQCRHVFNRSAESKSPECCHLFLDRFLDAEPFHVHALRELAILHQDSGDDDAYQQVLSRLAGACHQTGRYREELQFLNLLVLGATGDLAAALENRCKEAEALAAEQTDAIDETLIDFLHLEGEESASEESGEAEEPATEPSFEAPTPGEANGSDRVLLGVEEDGAAARESEIELIIEDDQFDEPSPVVSVEQETVPAEPAETPPAEPAEEMEPVVVAGAGADDPEDDIRERLTATRVFLSYGMLNKAMGQVEELLDRFPGRADVCELAAKIYKAQGRDDDAGAMQARLAELEPRQEVAEDPAPVSGEEAGRAAWMASAPPSVSADDEATGEPAAEMEVPVDPEPPEAPAKAPAATPKASYTVLDPLSEDLEEVDFFISQGFLSEAQELVQGLLKTNPQHVRLLELVRQIGGVETVETSPAIEDPETAAPAVSAEAGPPEPVAKPADPPQDSGTPLDDQQLSEVFSMFQEEVAGQVDDEDYGTHYDLGIAYKEMMLVDEAIGEFQIAARSSEKRLDCCCMLGACFMEKGMPGEAIKWYEKGMAVTETGSDEIKGLQYDLAAALEADGATANALEVFQALAAVDDQYRDVTARIDRLKTS